MRVKRLAANLAAALAFIMLAATALAAVDIDDSTKEVFANGHAITIEASGTNTVVKSEEADAGLASEGRVINGGYTIYGGSKTGPLPNGDIDTSVTMTGGEVANIVGGSKGGSLYEYFKPGTTNVVIEGGTVTGNVYGGSVGEDPNTFPGYFSGSSTVYADTNVTISGDALVKGNVYGGSGDRGSHILYGNTNVTYEEGTVLGEVKGGHNEVYGTYLLSGNTKVIISPKTKKVSVTFQYTFGGKVIWSEKVTSDSLKKGDSQTLTSSYAGDDEFESASGSKTVSFDDACSAPGLCTNQ
ncbi:MAG TPA: hypothetical protein PLH38_04860 [Clostridia bacterium]|nr:hypothetical protein [Clostridia bacterium]